MYIPKPLSEDQKRRERKHLKAIFGLYVGGLALVGSIVALPYARDAMADKVQDEVMALATHEFEAP